MLGQRAGCCNGKYNLNIPGRSIGLYLVTHEAHQAAKIGIGIVWANGHMPRVAVHLSHGWSIHAAWTGISALPDAYGIERAVIRRWREAGLPPAVTRAQMPQSGYTETVALAAVNLAALVRDIGADVEALGVSTA
jgi:hypothetical protein